MFTWTGSTLSIILNELKAVLLFLLTLKTLNFKSTIETRQTLCIFLFPSLIILRNLQLYKFNYEFPMRKSKKNNFRF